MHAVMRSLGETTADGAQIVAVALEEDSAGIGDVTTLSTCEPIFLPACMAFMSL